LPHFAEDADLGVGIERQVDIFQDLLSAWVGLAETLHVINELPRHGVLVFPLENISREGFSRRPRDNPDCHRTQWKARFPVVMAGLDPAIQTPKASVWMPGSRPGMT
jgi:hypothetical protein